MGKLMVKNWDKYQHYKHRDPPWIKLHRGLLNDLQWHKLDGEAAKTLVMIWLIASETNGKLPPLPDLAFRLRLSEQQLTGILQQLSHWLVQDDSGEQASCKHDASIELAPCEQDAPENQKHDSVSVSVSDSVSDSGLTVEEHFDRFIAIYPKREGGDPKKPAFEKFRSAVNHGVDPAVIIAGAVCYADECERKRTEPRYIPMAKAWLHQARWESYADAATTQAAQLVLVPVFEGTPQWAAHVKAGHNPHLITDVHDPTTGRRREGWHFKSEWPPEHSKQAA